jgi:hypothetical protein
LRVLLGNPAPKEAWRDQDGVLQHRDLDGARVTTISIPDTYTPIEAFAAVTAQDGAWNHHSQGNDPGDTTPDWLECDDELVGGLLAAHFGCPVGRPKNWKGEG